MSHLALVLARPAAGLWALMDRLTTKWKRRAGEVLYKYGYESPASW